MAKKVTPIITQTEIICRAIRSIEDEIKSMQQRCKDVPGLEDMLEIYTADRTPKLEALKVMYQIQTGVKYI